MGAKITPEKGFSVTISYHLELLFYKMAVKFICFFSQI